ncbi:uncharacterized protein LOC132034690 [Lycium ferocissimum]|uniref:uncharacterized protein LOC132034690 n=1 Tax=Lycium ferocissimum TaxID=112874 RepID=UPI0028165E74|nr:uncharacterized protein LOC132034690 [Lycium ferocissimum]
METPTSTRRVTRSQILAASNSTNNTSMSKINKETEKKEVTVKSALLDITNGSPIVGLATGILETPSSAVSRSTQRKKCCTPGSGEALLRGQVKNLLQMVEEEAEISKISLEKRPNFFHVRGIVNSPMNLLAPTPANTPLMDLFANEVLPPVTASPVEDKFVISQILNKMMFEGKKQESVESETSSNITRSLLLDFSDKSESSVCSSIFTYQAKEEECDDKYEEIDEDGGVAVDELCEAISNINVNGGGQKFAGKRTKFVYNSDDEFEGVEEFSASPGVLQLKGLPTPKGKHLRFPEEN